jgi:TonB-dependent starch-binding outer membrane protein SusC
VKDRERTGNISKVTAKEIQRQPVQNPIAALQGRVPGLEITQTSGTPGGNFKIRIRGTNSIANGNDPLFIIDGVPYTSIPLTAPETSGGILGNYSLNGASGGTSPLNSINPADIESIEVLKDADATAIYGSRGSNGVILITTRKGQAGKTKVAFNLYTGVSKLANKVDMLNTKEYLSMRKEALRNDNVTPTISNAADLLVWDTTRHTDWQDKLIGGTANTTDAQISLSGGENLTQFSIGTGYHKETTVFPGDNSDRRISFHVSITNQSPNKKLRTLASLSYSASNTNFLNQDLTSKALFLPPNAPALYNQNGELNWDGWGTSGLNENPLAYLKRRYESKSNTLSVSGEVGYFILPDLELKSRMGFNNMWLNSLNLSPKSALAPAVASVIPNITLFSNTTFENLMVEPQANWKPKFGKGQLDVLIGTQFLAQTTEGLTQHASGFTSEALMKNIAAAPNRVVGTSSYAQYRHHAVFGRMNYNHDGKYVINLTARRDGSSRFGPGKQFANFGAVGVAWIFSDEVAVRDAVPFLSFGKLRCSYGITGNDQFTDYQYLDAYTTSPSQYQGMVGLTPSRIHNPDFAWETNKKLEAALDLGFIHDRILTSVSLYRHRSSNQLVGNALPPTAGFSNIQANSPATLQNNGVEIELNTVNFRQKYFTWTTSFNVSLPRTKLLEFPNLINFPSYAYKYVVGEPLDIAKVYHYTGIDPLTGIYQFEDINGDGNYDEADKQTVRFTGTKFHGGAQNSFAYKGFQMDIFFQFIKNAGRNYLYTSSGAPGGAAANQADYVLDRWQGEGDNTTIQRFGRSSEITNAFSLYVVSDLPIREVFFTRLKNLSISYTLPASWMGKAGISNVRVFIQGQNLFTISNYKGMDPETVTGFLPPLKIITGGVSVVF